MNRITLIVIVLTVTGGCMTVEPDPINEYPYGLSQASPPLSHSGAPSKQAGARSQAAPAAAMDWASRSYGDYTYGTKSWATPPKNKMAASKSSSGNLTANTTAAKTSSPRPDAPKTDKGDETIVKTVYTETKPANDKHTSLPSPAKPIAAKPLVQTKTPPAEAEPLPIELGILRLINSKHIIIRYEVKDPSAAGVADLEIWGTTDLRTWKKYEGVKRLPSSLMVDVQSEGLYGFTVIARAKGDPTKNQPPVGEPPQMWVAVDLTKPVVQLLGTETNVKEKMASMVIRWNAKDRNLGARPITLFYAEHPEGPWLPIAANLENSGRHEWFVPAHVPANVCVRVQAVDLMGNIGMVQSAPIHIPVWTAVRTSANEPALGQPPPFTHSAPPPSLTHVPRPPRPKVSILSVEGQ